MTRARRDNWVLPLLGLAVGGVLVAAAWLVPGPVDRLRLVVSDYLFLDAAGPGWGRRPVPADIVLVAFDLRSAEKMQALPSVEQDLELYRGLLAGGARLVFDTRMIAATEGERLRDTERMLAAMQQCEPPGRLLRDMWLPGEVLAPHRHLVSHNLPNLHPVADAGLDARIYPLAMFEDGGWYESLALELARRTMAAPAVPVDEVRDELVRAGVPLGKFGPAAEEASAPTATPADSARPYRLGRLAIPWRSFVSRNELVPPAGFWIDYTASPTEFARVSYIEAATADVADKVVFIGYAAEVDPTSDTFSIPTSETRAGVTEVTAAAFETLRAGRLLRVPPRAVMLGVPVLVACLAALAGGWFRPTASLPATLVLLGGYGAAAVAAYRGLWLVDLVVPPVALVAGAVAGGGWRYLREVQARQRIVDLFGRYVPRVVVQQLVQLPTAEALALSGVKREVTVLFADVRGFTSFAERCRPEEVLAELNSLLKVMVECTFAHEGTVDKFIGDAILVLFNAPLDQPEHTLRAAETAWAIQAGLRNHPSGLSVGIGIHRGEAVVGQVGTPERMEYTAVGSTVNLASRLCGLAQGGQVVVSAEVAAALAADGRFELEAQPPVAVKGVDEPLVTSVLTGRRLPAGSPTSG